MTGRYYSADFEWCGFGLWVPRVHTVDSDLLKPTDAHAIMAEAAGLPKSIIEEIRHHTIHPSHGPPKSMTDAEDLAIWKFVSEMLWFRGKVSDEAFDGIKSRWGHRGGLELDKEPLSESEPANVPNPQASST
jgi:hypothetical protein